MQSIYERRILVGIASITATIILIGWLAINENARMQEFTERAQGRQIEQGAKLFEANCAPCHGNDGLGTSRAPALNNPHLFGYNFFGDIDNEILALEARLENESDRAVRDELQARLGELQAERTLLEETIQYDWSDKVGAADPTICAEKDGTVTSRGYSERQLCEVGEIGVQLLVLDAQAEQLEGVESAANLPIYVGQREAQELAPLQTELDTLNAKPAAELTAAESERLAQLTEQITALEDELAPYKDILDQRNALIQVQSRFDAVMTANTEVQRLRTELAPLEAELAALGEAPAEGGDPNAQRREELTTQISEMRTALDSADATRIGAYDELVANNDIIPYDPENYSRLLQVGWAGTLFDFVEGTLIGGRPNSASYWPQPMAAWAQSTGGPLRSDQIRNLTEYILNWNREFTIADLRAVEQFAKVPSEGGAVATGPTIGDNVTVITTDLETARAGGLVGDAAAGQALFEGSYGCAGCHGAAAGTGPAVVGVWTRSAEDQDGRLTNTNNVDNPENYLIQSIVQPSAFVVPGFTDGIMPKNFGDRMTIEELANILAYLETHDE